jgi:hypothetical protein
VEYVKNPVIPAFISQILHTIYIASSKIADKLAPNYSGKLSAAINQFIMSG